MKKLFTLIILFLSLQSNAQNEWIGAVNNQWNVAGNWSYGYVPIAGEDVVIQQNAKVVIPSGYNAFGDQVNINYFPTYAGEQDTLIIAPGASLSCWELKTSETHSTVFNQGNIYASYTVGMARGHFVNNGKIEVTGRLSIGFTSAADFVNNDSIIARGITNHKTFENNGYIKVTPLASSPWYDTPGVSSIGSASNFTNNGEIIKSSTGEFFIEVEDGLFFNNGYLEAEVVEAPGDGAEIRMDNEAMFSNGGTIILNTGTTGNSGFSMANDCIFENKAAGLFQIGSFGVRPININTGSEFINKGTLQVAEATNGDMIMGSSTFTNNSGILSGSGTIGVLNFDATGIISPGMSPGKITRSGNSNIGASLYVCEIEGTSGAGVPGGNDQYKVTQNLNLANAQLNINLISGFVPSLGDEFTIVLADVSLANTFGTINYPALPPSLLWDITYNSNDVVLSVISSPLPIDLIHFSAKSENGNHKIKWITAYEENASHFEIQHSIDGTKWNTIGDANAIGNTNSDKQYSFSSKPQTFAQAHYYRLKMIDLDGAFEYSNVVSIAEEQNNTGSIFPNPVKHSLNINGLESGEFQLYNNNGKIILSGIFEEDYKVDLSAYTPGIYILKIQTERENFSKKIIIE